MDKELIPTSDCNAITGDHMITKPSSEAYRTGWEKVFGKPKEDSLDAQKQSDHALNSCPSPKEAGN